MAPTVIAEISRLDLQGLSTSPSARISGAKHLSSYNWIERPRATIAVPGSPPLWSPSKSSRRLNKDSGLIYIAQNAARHPDSPLEPLFRALYITDPLFDMQAVDIVTDRNNIRKLLSFINPSSASKELEPFTINIEVIKNTALLCRDEIATQEFIGPHEFRGYGHEFEKAHTLNTIQDSTGHHRIISYFFSDLKFVVRYEADGYVGSSNAEPGGESLENVFENLSLSTAVKTPVIAGVGSKLEIQNEGKETPDNSVLEIKTRVSHKPIAINEIAPQLWVSQTPMLVRAYHNRGTFNIPQVEDMTDKIQKWEDANQVDLRRLAALIAKLASIVKQGGGKATVKYDDRGDKLVVWQASGRRMLPEDLYAKWTGTDVTTDRDSFDSACGQSVVLDQEKGHHKYTTRKDTPLSDVISYGLDHGFRHFFRRLPTQLSEYYTLCKALDSLAIDVLEGRQIRNILDDMKKGKSDWDPEERREISGCKSLARDSAFRLVYIFLHSAVRDSNSAYNATLFVISHYRIFRYRTRKVVLEAFMERFQASEKQQKSLNKWPVKEPGCFEEEDATTEDEYICYDSDFSF